MGEELLAAMNADQKRIQQERLVADLRDKLAALTVRVEALETSKVKETKKHG